MFKSLTHLIMINDEKVSRYILKNGFNYFKLKHIKRISMCMLHRWSEFCLTQFLSCWDINHLLIALAFEWSVTDYMIMSLWCVLAGDNVGTLDSDDVQPLEKKRRLSASVSQDVLSVSRCHC